MPGAQHLRAYERVQLPSWRYLGGETLATPDDDALTLPDDTDTVVISAETGACYYAVNGGIAGTNSPGYIPADGMQTVGPISNLTGVRVHSPTGTIHVQYYTEQP